MHPQAPIPYFPLISNLDMWGPTANVYSDAHLGMHDPLTHEILQHPISPNQIRNNTIIQHSYQLVYPPYSRALPVPVRRWQHVTQNTRALSVHRWQHVIQNGNQISRVQRIALVPNTAMVLPTPYQQPDLAHSPNYGPLTRNSFYFPAPAIGVPIRTPPYMAHSGMSVPTVSLPHQPSHFRYALNNTYLSATQRQSTPTIGNPASTFQSIALVPNIRPVPPMPYQPGMSAPFRTSPYPNIPVPTVSVTHQPPHFLHTLNNTNLYPRMQHTPSIGGQVDTINRRRVTQLIATSARQKNEIEENTELALLLNLPKDESVFYEWWKFTSSSGNAPN